MPEGGCVLFAVASFVSFFSLFSLLPFDVLGLAGLRLEVAGALSQSSPRIGFRTDSRFEDIPYTEKRPWRFSRLSTSVFAHFVRTCSAVFGDLPNRIAGISSKKEALLSHIRPFFATEKLGKQQKSSPESFRGTFFAAMARSRHFFSAACAAANRAIGTRYGEQDT
jgi:hypothetical protein